MRCRWDRDSGHTLDQRSRTDLLMTCLLSPRPSNLSRLLPDHVRVPGSGEFRLPYVSWWFWNLWTLPDKPYCLFVCIFFFILFFPCNYTCLPLGVLRLPSPKYQMSGRELQNERNRPLPLLHLEVFSRELCKVFDASGPPWMRTSLDLLPALLPFCSSVIQSAVDTFSMMAPLCAPVQAPFEPRACPSGSAPHFPPPQPFFGSAQLLRVEDEQLWDGPFPLSTVPLAINDRSSQGVGQRSARHREPALSLHPTSCPPVLPSI